MPLWGKIIKAENLSPLEIIYRYPTSCVDQVRGQTSDQYSRTSIAPLEIPDQPKITSHISESKGLLTHLARGLMSTARQGCLNKLKQKLEKFSKAAEFCKTTEQLVIRQINPPSCVFANQIESAFEGQSNQAKTHTCLHILYSSGLAHQVVSLWCTSSVLYKDHLCWDCAPIRAL